MLLNLTISFRDGKNSQKIVTGASIRNQCKAFIYLFFMEKEISFHSPTMFPQLMLESGLLYFLVESGQVQGQAGVGGRDWGILCHWRRGGEGGKRAHQHCTASKTLYNFTILFLFWVSKWSFTSMFPKHTASQFHFRIIIQTLR